MRAVSRLRLWRYAMNVLDHLTEEHRKVENMLAELASSQPGEEREETVTELEEALQTHMALEERYVYPLVKETVGAEEFTDATKEHNETRRALQQVRDLVDQTGFEAAVEELAAGIQHHVQEEEGEIFPKLRENAAAAIEGLGDPEQLEVAVEEGTAANPGA
jgi:iron-sulfur cluster repair protein YtfE (RIC family)